MKQLIALISSEGKTPKQLSKEAWAAYKKYKRVSAQVEKQLQKKITKIAAK